MAQYICVKSFLLAKYDAYGNEMKGQAFQINVNSIWEVTPLMTNKMQLESHQGWFELSRSAFKECFELVCRTE